VKIVVYDLTSFFLRHILILRIRIRRYNSTCKGWKGSNWYTWR